MSPYPSTSTILSSQSPSSEATVRHRAVCKGPGLDNEPFPECLYLFEENDATSPCAVPRSLLRNKSCKTPMCCACAKTTAVTSPVGQAMTQQKLCGHQRAEDSSRKPNMPWRLHRARVGVVRLINSRDLDVLPTQHW